MILLMCGSWNSQIRRDREENGDCWGRRERGVKLLLNSDRVSVLQDDMSSVGIW